MPGPFTDAEEDKRKATEAAEDAGKPGDFVVKGMRRLGQTAKQAEELPDKVVKRIKDAPKRNLKRAKGLIGMKKGGVIAPEKAKKILRDGTANGKPLTAKQKRFMGARAGGAPMKKAALGATVLDANDYLKLGFEANSPVSQKGTVRGPSGSIVDNQFMPGVNPLLPPAPVVPPVATPLPAPPPPSPPASLPRDSGNIRSASSAGGGSSGARSADIAMKRMSLEDQMSNSLGGSNYMRAVSGTLSGANSGGKRLIGAAEGTVVKASSNRLLYDGMRESAGLPAAKFGGFITTKGTQRGAKGWNGKRMKRAKGVMN